MEQDKRKTALRMISYGVYILTSKNNDDIRQVRFLSASKEK